MEKLLVENQENKGRVVMYENDVFAGEMTYSWAGDDKIIVDHTEVDPAFGGKGVGKKLFLKLVEFAKEKEIKVMPLCPFAKAMFDKNEEYKDLLF